MNELLFGKTRLRYLGITIALLCASSANADTTLDKMRPRIEDSAMVVAHVDMATFDFDKLMAAVADVSGNPAEIKGLQEMLRFYVKYLQDNGVDSMSAVMSLRDLRSGPYLIATFSGDPKNALKVGKELLSVAPDLNIAYRDDLDVRVEGNVMVLGKKETVARVMGDKTPKLSDERLAQVETAWKSAGNGVKVAFVPTQDTRLAIAQLTPPLPTPLREYQVEDILDGVHWASLGLDMDKGPNLKLTLQSKDQDSATKMAEILEIFTGMISQQVPKDAQGPVRRLLAPKQNGDQLVTAITAQEFKSLQKQLLGPMREQATQNQTVYKLKNIALAMLNFESAYGAFPPHASYGKGGKPMLSWRVYVLPFLEESTLYEEFHLDEPWDSEHNRELIPRMPDIYKNANGKVEEGKTTLQVPYGKECVFFGKNGTKLRKILDGTSRTLLCVDVAPKDAVVWTKPSDFEVDLGNALDRLLGGRDAFTACRCDGSVQRMKKGEIDAERVDGLLTKAGGEVVR